MGYSKQEQAFRAKDSALEKMAKQDFSGARKLALKARKLDPDIEDIAQIILVCDVHSRSPPLEGGGDDDERDWYKILDVGPKTDEDSVRHQFTRLAINLHPDRNTLPGAREAFQLVCRAKAVLTDDRRRRLYDCRRKSKTPEETRRSTGFGFSGFKNDSLDSGFAMFRNGPGPFDKGSLKGVKDGGGDAKLQNSGFAGFRNVSGSFGQGAEVQESSGFAAFRNGSGPFDHASVSNLSGSGDAKLQNSTFAAFRNGAGSFGQGVWNNGKAKVQESSGFATIQNRFGPFDHGSVNKLNDGVGNAKVQDSSFAAFGKACGPFQHGSVNNSNGEGGNAKVQNSGFPAFRGSDLFNRGSLSNLKDGAGNAKLQCSGFGTFQNGSGPFNQGSVSNVKDGVGNAKVQESSFATFQNGSGMFKRDSSSNINDGAENGKVSFNNHGSSINFKDNHDSLNNLKYGARNAEVQATGFSKFRDGPVLFGQGVSNNIKDGDENAKVRDSGVATFQDGHGSLSNIKDGAGNAKVQDLGVATFRDGHGSSSNIKDGGAAGNAKVQDSGFATFQNRSVQFDQVFLNNLELGDGNEKSQDPSVTENQNGPSPSDQELLNDERDNAGAVQKADVSKPKECVKKVAKRKNRRVTARKSTGKNSGNCGVKPQFLNNPGEQMVKDGSCGVKPQLPGNFIAPEPTEPRVIKRPAEPRVIKNLEYSDSELSDFEKGREKECFSPGQIWAVYDTLDAMPRFYAHITDVISSDNFKVHITWLEPCPDNEMEKKWLYKGLPASCGRFKLGESEEINDGAIFSHLVSSEKDVKSGNIYRVYPRQGETWAVFKNWKMDWCLDPEARNVDAGYEFDFVEVTSDYCDDMGVSVGFLGKIKGFSTIFSRMNDDEEVKIPAKDKLRFSHRVSSFRMMSPNRNAMFFELDPASLPENLNGCALSEILNISDIFN